MSASGEVMQTTDGENSRIQSGNVSARECTDNNSTESRSGNWRHTSSVCWPIEPEAPHSAIAVVLLIFEHPENGHGLDGSITRLACGDALKFMHHVHAGDYAAKHIILAV